MQRSASLQKAAGGTALVQSPNEALWNEMPLSAIGNDGRINFVGTIKDIVREFAAVSRRMIKRHFVTSKTVRQKTP
jgi:hypothetical protein